jgi:pyruvate kinase
MKTTSKKSRYVKARKTKIVATVGPNSSTVPVLISMLNAGMNVARINFSHGNHEEHAEKISNIREAAEKAGLPVAILQDLGGPKIRIGDFETDTVTLEVGQKFTLTTNKIKGNDKTVSINYKRLPAEVKKDMDIMVNDGKLQLKVLKTTETDVVCKVMVGGTIRGRRGVNVPGASLSINTITAKDKKDLVFGIEQGVNFVTLSFVRKASEIHQLRKLLGTSEGKIGIVAKIETQEAVNNLDEIILAADGIMVARGDLAVEIPSARVPLIQKEIIKKCNIIGKPVITATQMLDSMREQTTPTRAEVNDVANAILDGSDAVMLSDETAVGKYPVEAVKVLARIANTIEENNSAADVVPFVRSGIDTVADAVTEAIARESIAVGAVAIVALSESGHTGRLVARHRPTVPVYVLTPNEKTFYQSLLVYGCQPILVERVQNIKEALGLAQDVLVDCGLCRKGDRFILGAGMPFGTKGTTNVMVIGKIE